MSNSKSPILVFGATGQQGGAVAAALLKAGRAVRAFVRDIASEKSTALRAAGAELVQGSFSDIGSIRRAMAGAEGVFSVQPSSPGGQVSDEEEVRFGIAIADLAVEAGVQHLVYSSGAGAQSTPTGMGHFDSKARIEAHIRSLPIIATIVRPGTFMEMLVMPGFGLNEGRFNFFLQPDQAMQFIAVEDIGKLVAAVFADPVRLGGQSFDIAGDSVTGRDLEILFTKAAGRPIPYARFSDEVLAANPFLRQLTALMDAGILSAKADFDILRKLNPDLLTLRSWLAGAGRAAFEEALGKGGAWAYNRRLTAAADAVSPVSS